jgi:DNA-binding NtrC family response regulator
MVRVLWVGLRPPPPQLEELLAQQDCELTAFKSADEALASLGPTGAAVAIVTADQPEAAKWVERLTSERSDLQVLLATDTGISRQVVLSLWAGASGVLEFRSQSRNEIVLEIQEWITRHRQVQNERDLLLRLHTLNDEFLKTIVTAEKRALELEDKLEAAKRPVASDEGPAQLLLVDDEPVILDVLARILSKNGHQIMQAPDGETAVKMLWEHGFHVVISDKNLPGLSGLDLIKQVKELSPDTDCVLITGYSSKEAAIDALNKGASAYIEKPFDDIKTVRDRIEKVISDQRDRVRRKHHLARIKDRNKEFLDRYRVLRADLEAWIAQRKIRLKE